MKNFVKLIAASLCLISASAFAQNGKFVTDQVVDNNITLGVAKSVNPKDVLYIDENPAAKTIVINYADGVTVENWVFASAADYWAVLDKFVTGERRLGNDWYYTSVYGSNAHRRLSYHNIRKTSCAVTQPGGGAFYTATITMKNGGAPIISDGYSIYVCANLTY